MAHSKIDPSTLAHQLDEVLPPDSGLILDGEYDNPSLNIAKMLAEYSNEQLSTSSHDLIQERMMLALDEKESKRWRRGTPRILLSVAMVALIAGCAAILGLISTSPNVMQTLSGIFSPEQTENVTVTEELLMTSTPTEVMPTEIEAIATATEVIPTEIEATATGTEIPPTLTATPTDIPPTVEATASQMVLIPTLTPEPVAAFVQVNTVNVRAEPNADAQILAIAGINEEVSVIATNNDDTWSQVELSDDTIGWIASDLLGESRVNQPLPANNDNNNDDNRPPRNDPPPNNPPPPDNNDGNRSNGNNGGNRGNRGGGN